MINSLNPILNMGITRCDKLQVHHLRMVNLLTCLCTGGTLLFSALFWLAFGSAAAALLNGLFAVLYLITFVLTREGILWIAKYWIFVTFFLQQLFLPLFVLSDNFETELLLLVVPTAVVLVFDPKARFPRYGLSLIAIFLLFLAKTVPSADPILALTDTNAQAAYLCVILILVLASAALTDFYLVDLHNIDEQSRKLVHEDMLTGTANSQSLYSQADELFFQSRRRETPLSVVVINLDDFSQINEMHGRQTGDQVLIHIADLIQEQLPPQTPIGRLYADTFVVLLENSPPNTTMGVAKQIKLAIGRSVLLLDNTAVKLTASLGVTTSNDACLSGAKLVDMANSAVNNAKKRGKNKIQAIDAKEAGNRYHCDNYQPS